MTLMILAHPDFEHSVANKTIAEELQKNMPDLELRNIHQLYPDYNINANAEQATLQRHGLIILQYPMYWFNMPAILKQWFDQVFTYQFAYGSQGDKLKNKKLIVSITIGQPEENFNKEGHYLIDDFLQSVKRSAQYSQMDYLPPIITHGVASILNNSEEEIKQKALLHSQKLISTIKNMTENKE